MKLISLLLILLTSALASASATTVLTPLKDTYIRSNDADTNFGSETIMVSNWRDTGMRYALFSFDISSITEDVTGVKLELHENIGGVSKIRYEIYGLLDAHDDWDENTLTWNNASFLKDGTLDLAATYGGKKLGDFNTAGSNVRFTAFNVTSGNHVDFLNAAGNNSISFIIVDPSNDKAGTAWATKEHATQLKPTLTIATASSPPDANEGSLIRSIRVFLVGGQSNADGRAAVSGLPTSPVNLQLPQNDIDFYYKVEGQAPWLTTLRPGLSKTNQFGPEITLGRRLADALADGADTRVALIKYANGGTNLHTHWKAGGDGTSTGDGPEYLVFQQTVTSGFAALANAYPGAAIEIEGMLWVQGESDSDSVAQASNYQANLTDFITDIRATYGADLLFVVSRLSSGQTWIDSNSLATIRAAQSAEALADPLSALLDTDGFGIGGDNLHFNALGFQQIGNGAAGLLLNYLPFTSPPSITLQSGSNLKINVPDIFSGFSYTLRSSATLQRGSWEFEESIIADSDSTAVEFTVTPNPLDLQRFYRVERTLGL